MPERRAAGCIRGRCSVGSGWRRSTCTPPPVRSRRWCRIWPPRTPRRCSPSRPNGPAGPGRRPAPNAGWRPTGSNVSRPCCYLSPVLLSQCGGHRTPDPLHQPTEPAEPGLVEQLVHLRTQLQLGQQRGRPGGPGGGEVSRASSPRRGPATPSAGAASTDDVAPARSPAAATASSATWVVRSQLPSGTGGTARPPRNADRLPSAGPVIGLVVVVHRQQQAPARGPGNPLDQPCPQRVAGGADLDPGVKTGVRQPATSGRTTRIPGRSAAGRGARRRSRGRPAGSGARRPCPIAAIGTGTTSSSSQAITSAPSRTSSGRASRPQDQPTASGRSAGRSTISTPCSRSRPSTPSPAPDPRTGPSWEVVREPVRAGRASGCRRLQLGQRRQQLAAAGADVDDPGAAGLGRPAGSGHAASTAGARMAGGPEMSGRALRSPVEAVGAVEGLAARPAARGRGRAGLFTAPACQPNPAETGYSSAVIGDVLSIARGPAAATDPAGSPRSVGVPARRGVAGRRVTSVTVNRNRPSAASRRRPANHCPARAASSWLVRGGGDHAPGHLPGDGVLVEAAVAVRPGLDGLDHERCGVGEAAAACGP